MRRTLEASPEILADRGPTRLPGQPGSLRSLALAGRQRCGRLARKAREICRPWRAGCSMVCQVFAKDCRRPKTENPPAVVSERRAASAPRPGAAPGRSPATAASVSCRTPLCRSPVASAPGCRERWRACTAAARARVCPAYVLPTVALARVGPVSVPVAARQATAAPTHGDCLTEPPPIWAAREDCVAARDLV